MVTTVLSRVEDETRVSGGIERLRGEPIIYSEGIYSVELNPGLQEREVQNAWDILRWIKGYGPFLGIAGTMLVSGGMRQGKGLFGNTLAWMIKQYFRGKRVLRDDLPADLFGEYTLFNEDRVLRDVATMSEIAEAESYKDGKAPKSAKEKAKLREKYL